MDDNQTRRTSQDSRPPAGGKVKRLFDSPYRIGSPEAPADLSHIGNGRGHLIDKEVEQLISEAEKNPALAEEELEGAED